MKRIFFLIFLAPALVSAESFHAHYNADGTVNLEIFPWKEHTDGTESEFMRKRCFDPDGDFDELKRNQLPPDRSERARWRGRKGQGIRVDRTIPLPETMPSIQDQLNAIYEGGQALQEMKERVNRVRGTPNFRGNARN